MTTMEREIEMVEEDETLSYKEKCKRIREIEEESLL
jgi:hypothetical protein